jgi:O-antigen/teichoic acid export membrane protein
MLRRFAADSAVYGVSALLSQGIGVLLFPLLAHHFSPREYGIIDILTLVAILANLTVALEVNQGLGRHFVDASEPERVDYASTALLFTAGAYTVVAAIALPLATPLTHVLLTPGVDPWITRVAILWIWVAGIVYLAQDQLRWRMRPRAYGLVAVTTATVTASSTAVLVLGFGVGVIGALIGQLVGALAAALVVFVAFQGRLRPALRSPQARRHARVLVAVGALEHRRVPQRLRRPARAAAQPLARRRRHLRRRVSHRYDRDPAAGRFPGSRHAADPRAPRGAHDARRAGSASFACSAPSR